MGECYVPRGRLLADGQAGTAADEAVVVAVITQIQIVVRARAQTDVVGRPTPPMTVGVGAGNGRIQQKTLIVQVLHGSSSF